MNISKSENPKQKPINVSNFLPHILKKRINKTAEGRSGDAIYKRRNRRSYRVLLQYSSWLKMKNSSKHNLLNHYRESYIVAISPEEYFGDSYPNKSDSLHPDFELNKNGFIYYTNIGQFQTYSPLNSNFKNWIELYEISTVPLKNYKSWIGEYALNIRNASPNKISIICSSGDIEKEKKAKVIKKIVKKLCLEGIDINKEEYSDLKHSIYNLPKQRGIGNYDFDYATEEMVSNVKRQMLSLIFLARSRDNLNLSEYILDNYELLSHSKDTKTFLNLLKSDDYTNKFNTNIERYIKYCKDNNLLNYDKLKSIGVIKKEGSIIRPVCPLCKKEIYIEDFFTDILQFEGRFSPSNTQKEIVLMHIDALQPLKLNHRTYNLGWGHNFCNMIQGDKSIDETIDDLKNIIQGHNLYEI